MEFSEILGLVGKGILILLGLGLLFGVIWVISIIRGVKEIVDRTQEGIEVSKKGYKFAKKKLDKKDYKVIDPKDLPTGRQEEK